MLPGKLCSPIREMLDDNEVGGVIFHTAGFKQSMNSRISVLNLRKRYNYKYTTKLVDDEHLAVIKEGGENLPSRVVDLRGYE